MDNKALYDLTYGVFMLSAKEGDKVNGCIINTGIQVASNPARIAISCINANLTCEYIKKSKVFTLTVLDQSCTFQTISHFGMQSGRNVNKFEDFECPSDINGLPYLGWQSCAVISCHVVEMFDLGSHTLFVAEIDDAVKLSDNMPLTYAFYQNNLKPKSPKVNSERKIVAWKCKICGYVFEGSELPKDFICPVCGHDVSDFEPIY